jgi:hypothetical protein
MADRQLPTTSHSMLDRILSGKPTSKEEGRILPISSITAWGSCGWPKTLPDIRNCAGLKQSLTGYVPTRGAAFMIDLHCSENVRNFTMGHQRNSNIYAKSYQSRITALDIKAVFWGHPVSRQLPVWTGYLGLRSSQMYQSSATGNSRSHSAAGPLNYKDSQRTEAGTPNMGGYVGASKGTKTRLVCSRAVSRSKRPRPSLSPDTFKVPSSA